MGPNYPQSAPIGQAAYRPGSTEDFDRLYRASYPRLVRTLAAVVGNATVAEDYVQEAFVRAFKAWRRWKPEAPAEAWVHRIALNVASSPAATSGCARWASRFAGSANLRSSATRRQWSMVPTYSRPPRQAAAIVLRHYHAYTNREIGVALGIPERTVASRLAAAKRRLRSELGAAWNLEMGTSGAPGVLHGE
jgi:RNA polymerase sigma-70 factor (ECF subfamily)